MTTTKGRAPSRRTIADDLRAEIEGAGMTAYALGKSAGVDPGVISRFASGERDVTLTTAGRLADALGLRLVGGGAARGRGRPKKTSPPARRESAVEHPPVGFPGGPERGPLGGGEVEQQAEGPGEPGA